MPATRQLSDIIKTHKHLRTLTLESEYDELLTRLRALGGQAIMTCSELSAAPELSTKLIEASLRQRLPVLKASQVHYMFVQAHPTGGIATLLNAACLAEATGWPTGPGSFINTIQPAVSGAQLQSLIGQAYHRPSAQAVLKYALSHLQLPDSQSLRFADSGSGAGFFADVVFQIRPDCEYIFAIEAVDICLRAHRRAHGTRVQHVFDRIETSIDAAAALGHVHLYQAFWGCAAFSDALRNKSLQKSSEVEDRRQYIERNLELLQESLRYVKLAQPDIVILENVASVLQPRLMSVFIRVETMLSALGDYIWTYQIICPHTHLDADLKRNRLWLVGSKQNPRQDSQTSHSA